VPGLHEDEEHHVESGGGCAQHLERRESEVPAGMRGERVEEALGSRIWERG